MVKSQIARILHNPWITLWWWKCTKNLNLFTGVGRFFQFLKNRQFQFFQYRKIKEWVTLVLWKEFEIKESLVWDISKNLFLKPIDFHERTSGSLPNFLDGFMFLRTIVIYQNQFFKIFKNQWVSKYIYTQVDNREVYATFTPGLSLHLLGSILHGLYDNTQHQK